MLADGAPIRVIGLTDRQWRGLVKATGTGEAMTWLESRKGISLKDEGNRWRLRHEITAILAPWFAARPLAEVAAALDAAGCTWSEFRSFARAVREDPDLSADNPMMAEVAQPGIGTYPVPGSPVAFGALPRAAPAPAPVLGADTEAVLADVAGLSSGEIGRLMDAGVVTGPRPV